MRLNLGLTGMPGSGKTTAGDYLEARHGFKQFMGSDFLKQQAAQEGIALASRAQFAQYYEEQRQLRGNDFIASLGLEMPGDRVVNVGVRTRSDVERFINAGGVLLGIVCDVTNRFDRTAGTNPKYPTDISDFIEVDKLENTGEELGMNVYEAMQSATHIIDNNSTTEEFYGQLDDIVDLYASQQR